MPVPFLLEIGCEEIPDWMIVPALKSLQELLEKVIAENNLGGQVSWTDATPRRLVIYIEDLKTRQEDSEEVVMGPPKAANPNAIAGFAKKQGIDQSALKIFKSNKGEYWGLVKSVIGRDTKVILAEALPTVIGKIYFPKTMYWTGKAGFRFIRPIRWLVALLGDEVVDFELASVKSGNITRGHRKLGSSAIPVTIENYRQTLKDNYVLVMASERRAKIRAEIKKLGAHIKPDPGLLETLVYITEYPAVIAGEFDQQFLELPEEVLVTVMRHHQKYFSVLRTPTTQQSTAAQSTTAPHSAAGAQSTASPHSATGAQPSAAPHSAAGPQSPGAPYSATGLQSTTAPYSATGAPSAAAPHSATGPLSTASPSSSAGPQSTTAPSSATGAPSAAAPHPAAGPQSTTAPYSAAGPQSHCGASFSLRGASAPPDSEYSPNQTTLAPAFVAVMNTAADPDGLVRKGNERVLRARFNDARFFYQNDQHKKQADRVTDLEKVTFQAKLGTYLEKTFRVVDLVQELGGTKAAERAATLAKTDLTTEMVKEFTDLQGIVGGLYAKAQGEPEPVWRAIYEHYKPLSMEDGIPSTPEGRILAVADKLDTLRGYFEIGLVPSGSKDPFALRRAAQGVVKILVEGEMKLPLTTLIGSNEALKDFMLDRVRYYFKEVRGYKYDEVNAVLKAGAENLVDVADRLEAVQAVRPTEDFEPLAAAFKRIQNILKQAGVQPASGPIQEQLLDPGPERELYERFQSLRDEISGADYTAALEAIASIRPQVDHFFDKVMVNVPDEAVRANRLKLLGSLLVEFSTIADFSEIVTQS